MIKIFQINLKRDKDDVVFRGYHIFKKYGIPFEFSIYDEVWSGEIPEAPCNTEGLDGIFEIFNLYHPENFFGRSLSVSDIVQVIDEPEMENGFYYCDSIGWEKLEL